jgi:hypothetical protein
MGYNPPNATNPGYSSSVVNGQLVPVFTLSALRPSQAAAPYYRGSGAKPPTLAGYGFNALGPGGMASGGVVGTGIGGGGVGASMITNPFDPRQSSVVWAMAFLLVGIVGLRYIHFAPAS